MTTSSPFNYIDSTSSISSHLIDIIIVQPMNGSFKVYCLIVTVKRKGFKTLVAGTCGE
jgi:hypothetical protein